MAHGGLKGFYDLLLTRYSEEPIEFLNYLEELFDPFQQPVLKISMRGTHGNCAAFRAAVVQSDLGKLDWEFMEGFMKTTLWKKLSSIRINR